MEMKETKVGCFILEEVLLIFFFLIATGISATRAEVRNLTLSHYLPISHPVSKALVLWAKDVATQSNGTLHIRIFPSSQLYKTTENFDAVSDGAVDLALNGLFGETGENPVFGVMGLPFVWPSFEAVISSCKNGLNTLMDEEAKPFGVKIIGVAFVDYAQWFTTKKPLISPEDFKGVRLRVYPGFISDAVQVLGGAAITMPSSEVYNALQRGIVDGYIGTVASTLSGKYYEVAKYGVIGPFSISPIHLIANLKTWESLSPHQQQVITLALEKMAYKLTTTLKENTLIAGPTQLTRQGMHVYFQTPEEVAIFKKALQPVYERCIQLAGEKGQQALDMIEHFKRERNAPFKTHSD
jgi:C4-dicarboxylate-binding protein DctP